MPKTRKQKLEEIFYANASPEERLAYDLKKSEKKVNLLENLPIEEKIVEVKKEVIKEVPNPITGEDIVQLINALELVTSKQIDFSHIKNFPWHEVKKMGDKLISWGHMGTWLNGETTTNSKLIVSATPPSNPSLYDLWYDIS